MTESYAKTVAAASAIAQDFIMTTLDDSADGVRDVDQVLYPLVVFVMAWCGRFFWISDTGGLASCGSTMRR